MVQFKHIFSFLVLALLYNIVLAADFSSTSDGDWSNNATWGGSSYPSLSTADNITVNDAVSTSSDITIKTNGYLIIKAGASLTVHDLEFSNGSHIIIEEGGQLFVTGNLSNKNNSDDVEVNGSIEVTGNFDNGNGGVIYGIGELHADGSFTGSGVTFNQTNSSITSGSTVTGGNLPVELLLYTITSFEDGFLIKWTTATETNNDYFTIERSSDGKDFMEIATISGSGNSNSAVYYEYFDQETLAGASYYRLKQTDYNGHFEYLGILTSYSDSATEQSVLFENPVKSENFSVTFPNEGVYVLELYNFNGQRVYQNMLNISSNSTIIRLSEEIKTGCYMLVVSEVNKQPVSYKIIIE